MIEFSMLWSAGLTIVLGLVGWGVKTKERELEAAKAEISRISILVNKTREEVAKEYVTKVDVHLDINRVLDRLDRMEGKLDDFIRDQKNALN
jgi:hypothetical protein